MWLVALLAGCACEREHRFVVPPATSEPWDRTFLVGLDPNSVTTAALASHVRAAQASHDTYQEVLGQTWQATRTIPAPDSPAQALPALPDRYGSGGDTLLFTGFSVAASAFHYGVGQPDVESQHDLEQRLKRQLGGLHLLTNCTGTPGVLARCAAPAAEAGRFASRQSGDFTGRSPAGLFDPWGAPYPEVIYYTRATKDQLTGLVLGLAATLEFGSPSLRDAAAQIGVDVFMHLERHAWRIRDHEGKNDTSADDVDDMLKAAVLAMAWRAHVRLARPRAPEIEALYRQELEQFTQRAWILSQGDRFNNFQQYYGFSLRSARALTIWLLDPAAREDMAAWHAAFVWRFTRFHSNAWHAAVRAVMVDDPDARLQAVLALKDASLRPSRNFSSPFHGQEEGPGFFCAAFNDTEAFVVSPRLREPAGYWTWQHAPWSVGHGPPDHQGPQEVSGLDLVLPYWLLRVRGGIP
jgi:hypothetical protein